MFLALLLVCNSHGDCTVAKAPQLSKTQAECVKMLDIGAENMAQQGLSVVDLMCVQFSVER